MKPISRLIILFLLTTAATVTHGQVFNFLLSGFQADGTTLVSATGSGGYASATLAGGTFSWNIRYEGTGALSAAHFHGPAGPGVNAGVTIGVGTSASPIIGSSPVDSTQTAQILAGNWYLNLHTPANPGGELRGQTVSQLSFTPNVLISGSQEVGPVVTAGGGAAAVVFNTSTNQLFWDVAYEGLTGTVTSAHFHGPAAAGVNAGVKVGLNPTTGTTAGDFSGSTVLSNVDDINDLLNGLWYINIHTSAHAGGEIRGQVDPVIVPEISTFSMIAGLLTLGAVIALRRRKR